MSRTAPPRTPDGRYIVVRGRLWRASDPSLPEATRARLVAELAAARRAVGAALRSRDGAGEAAARARVDAAKHALGERGAPWWTDGAPDMNRRLARGTPYAAWHAALASAEAEGAAMSPRDTLGIRPDTPAPDDDRATADKAEPEGGDLA